MYIFVWSDLTLFYNSDILFLRNCKFNDLFDLGRWLSTFHWISKIIFLFVKRLYVYQYVCTCRESVSLKKWKNKNSNSLAHDQALRITFFWTISPISIDMFSRFIYIGWTPKSSIWITFSCARIKYLVIMCKWKLAWSVFDIDITKFICS